MPSKAVCLQTGCFVLQNPGVILFFNPDANKPKKQKPLLFLTAAMLNN
jgi:hypothetical protein